MRSKKIIKLTWICILLVCAACLFSACQSQDVSSGDVGIGPDAAKEAALSASGEDAGEVTFTRARLETDGEVAIYRVEFYSIKADYEYEINAEDGSVLDERKTILRHPLIKDSDENTEENFIGAGQARAVALADAGLDEREARFDKVIIQFEEGKNRYRICFSQEDVEYEYDIDAVSGEVLRKQIDDEDE